MRILPRKRLTLLAVALLSLPAIVALAPSPRRDASTPLPITVWIWNTGGRIDGEAVRQAMACGIDAPFVKAGTFSLGREGLEFRAEVEREDLPDIPCRLVYSFDPEVPRAFEQLGAEGMARAIALAYRGATMKAIGLQVDLDCSTRLLPLYARMLHLLRAALPQGTELSTTTLLCWFDAPALDEVLREVDFHVPMAFGYRVPQRIEEQSPIADRDHVLATARACDRKGKPYWMGLGAYGYVLSFRPDGTLEHVHGKSNVREVMEAGARWLKGMEFETDRPVDLRGIEVPAGRRLRCERISASQVAAWVGELRREAGPLCRGVVLFRLAGKDDPLALSTIGLSTIARGGEGFLPQVRVEGTGRRLRVVLSNAGQDDGPIAPGGYRVAVRITHGRFLSARAGTFEHWESLAGEERATLGRSDRLVFTTGWLGGGESLASGSILLDRPGEVQASVDVPGGAAVPAAPHR